MKLINTFIAGASIFFIASIPVIAENNNNSRSIDIDSVTVVEKFNNLYKSGDYYFGGQPSIEMLNWLKSEGVIIVLNLRSDKEMEQYTEMSYNEKKG